MAELNPDFQTEKDKRDTLSRSVEKPIWTHAIVAKDFDEGKPISSMRFDIPFDIRERVVGDIYGILFDPKEGNIAVVMKKPDEDFKKADS